VIVTPEVRRVGEPGYASSQKALANTRHLTHRQLELTSDLYAGDSLPSEQHDADSSRVPSARICVREERAQRRSVFRAQGERGARLRCGALRQASSSRKSARAFAVRIGVFARFHRINGSEGARGTRRASRRQRLYYRSDSLRMTRTQFVVLHVRTKDAFLFRVTHSF